MKDSKRLCAFIAVVLNSIRNSFHWESLFSLKSFLSSPNVRSRAFPPLTPRALLGLAAIRFSLCSPWMSSVLSECSGSCTLGRDPIYCGQRPLRLIITFLLLAVTIHSSGSPRGTEDCALFYKTLEGCCPLKYEIFWDRVWKDSTDNSIILRSFT